MDTIVTLVAGILKRLLIQSRKGIALLPLCYWGVVGAVLTWERDPLQTSRKGFLPVDQELEGDAQNLLLVCRRML